MKLRNWNVCSGRMLRFGGALLLVCVTAACDWMSTDRPESPTSTLNSEDAQPLPTAPGTDSREVTIARCLSSQGAALYGASWCPYTQKQKQSFKDGLPYLNYIECTENPELCVQKGIRGYPTWIVRGVRLEGCWEPEDLGAFAGCSR